MKVIFITNSDTVLYPIRQTGRNTLIFGMLIIILIITANIVITHFIAKPINQLVNHVGKFQTKENLENKLSSNSRILEISILTESFNLMIERIRQLISSVYEHEKSAGRMNSIYYSRKSTLIFCIIHLRQSIGWRLRSNNMSSVILLPSSVPSQTKSEQGKMDLQGSG